MGRYLLRRLLLLVPVLLGVSVVVFLVLHLSPGDPAEIMLGSQASQEDVARLRADLGLDEPLPLQYARWMAHVLQGDLGRSIRMRQPVLGPPYAASRSGCSRPRGRDRSWTGSAPSDRSSARACRASGWGSS